jgi:hypothetical protein
MGTGYVLQRAVLTSFLLLATVAPSSGAQAPANTVVMLADRDSVAGTRQMVFHPGNTRIMSLASTRSELRVYVVTEAESWLQEESWDFEFSAPVEWEMTPGVYDRAWYSFRHDVDGRPGIDVSGEGRGCESMGRFEVKDIAFGPDDNLDRLWLVFEQHCGGPVVGEVRINMNEPALPTPVVALPSVLRFGETDLGRENGPLAVTVLASDATQITSVSLGGESPSAFPVHSDGCSGATLAAGATCQVSLRFVPPAAGTHRALLTIADSAGRAHEVSVEGFSWDATTRAVLKNESDAAQDTTYTPANADIGAFWLGHGIGFDASAHNGNWINAMFRPPIGEALAPGRYVDPGGPEADDQPNLKVTPQNGSCTDSRGEFTVTELRTHGDGDVRSAGIDFVQYCDGSDTALRGTFDWRRGDETPAAPWITGTWAGVPLPPGQYEAGPPWITETVPGPSDPPAPNTGPDPPAPTRPRTPCSGRTFSEAATMLGTSRADTLRGRARDDLILARGGNDRVVAVGGADCVDGGRGRDRLYGGRGNDVIFGGRGRDLIDCGRGRHDIARVTRGDRTSRCERKVRQRS